MNCYCFVLFFFFQAEDGIRDVCWTGGEPLLQAESIAAAVRRLPEDFIHSFETDGEVDLHTFDRLASAERASGRVRYVMDVKCPGSGMKAEKAYANLGLLQPHDEVKFVLRDREDYEFARRVLSAYGTKAQTVLFSPVAAAHKVSSGLDPARLAAWIVEDRLPGRLRLLLHKILWPGKGRGEWRGRGQAQCRAG